MDNVDNKLTLKHFLTDGGLKSRKLWLSVFCLVLFCAFVGAACHWAQISGLFSEFVTGVLGVLGIYVTGNAAGRWGNAKHIGSKLVVDGVDESSPDPEPRKPVELPAK